MYLPMHSRHFQLGRLAIHPLFKSGMKGLTSHTQALTAVIMNEATNPDSKWAPYFKVLPEKLDSLAFWSPEELAELQASAVVKKIGKEQAEEVFRDQVSKIVPEGSSSEFFHRVASTIMAYAFDIPEAPLEDEEKKENAEDDLVEEEEEITNMAMIPLADMLNADVDNNARLHYDGDDLEMRAIKSIRAGEEILNDYGQLPRSDLLRRYGYVTDKYAVFDVAELPTAPIISYIRKDLYKDHKVRQTEVDARVELAKREDVYEDSYDIAHADEEYPAIPDELVAFIWTLLIDKETFAALKSSKLSLPPRPKMETKLVGSMIQSLLSRRAKEYGTTIEEDIKLLEAADLPHRTRMAIQVRQGEKFVLLEAGKEAARFTLENKRMIGQPVTKRGREEADTKAHKKSRR